MKEVCEILTTWCTCVAGTSLCCNHIIAILYKLNYAYKKGYSNPICTSIPEGWNKGTRREIKPMPVTELFIRNDSCAKSEKKTRSPLNSKAKQMFDPRHPTHRQLTDDCVSELYRGIKRCLPNASVLYSVDESMSPAIPLSLGEAASSFMSQPGYSERPENELAAPFLEYIQLTEAQKQKIEEDTRDQSMCTTWKDQRLGRITASVVHEVMTKTDTIIKRKQEGSSAKYTPLVNRIVNGSQVINNEAIKWGNTHEKDAIKTFMAQEAFKHDGGLNNVRKCGLTVKADESFLGASPDGLFSCKCCGTAVLECKCPYSIRNSKIQDVHKNVDFLEMIDGSLRLRRSHKYYSQIIMQMAMCCTTHGYFIIWTINDFFIEIINCGRDMWNKLLINASFFFKSYVLPVLLGQKDLCFCPNCSKVVLEGDEIESSNEHSVCCDDCDTWWHWKCANITSREQVNGVYVCPGCILDISQSCDGDFNDVHTIHRPK